MLSISQNLTSIQITLTGWSHAWHFDESHFSTTIMLQKPEDGGYFQHTQPIRAGLGARKKQKEVKINLKIIKTLYYVFSFLIFHIFV